MTEEKLCIPACLWNILDLCNVDMRSNVYTMTNVRATNPIMVVI